MLQNEKNEKDKTMKHLEDNIGEYLHDAAVERAFLNRTQKALP